MNDSVAVLFSFEILMKYIPLLKNEVSILRSETELILLDDTNWPSIL